MVGIEAIARVKMLNRNIPMVNIFFLPTISESLPKGTRNIAEERIYEVTTHPVSTAFNSKSLAMAGKTIFVDETIKGVINPLIIAAMRATLCKDLLLSMKNTPLVD